MIVVQISKHEVPMRNWALVTGVVTLMALGGAATIKLLIPATSAAVASQAVPISIDESQGQVDARALPVLHLEDLFPGG
jgi:hypothetical protein